jgi:hypothetical protein
MSLGSPMTSDASGLPMQVKNLSEKRQVNLKRAGNKVFGTATAPVFS